MKDKTALYLFYEIMWYHLNDTYITPEIKCKLIEAFIKTKELEKEQLLMAYNTGVNISNEFFEEEKENIKVKYNK